MLRRTGYVVAEIEQFNQSRAELPSSAVGRMAKAGKCQRCLGHASDRHDPPPRGEHAHEAQPGPHLDACGPPVRPLRPGVRGDDVPEEHIVLEVELREDAVDDGRRGLRGPCSGELALRGERDPGDPGTAVPGRLADEQQRRASMRAEIPNEAIAEEGSARPLGVLVERVADAGTPELSHECLRRYHGASVVGSSGNRAERAARSAADPKNLIWVMPAEEGVSDKVVVVVAGGEAPRAGAALSVPLDATVVAADGGLEHAERLGLDVAVAVGDFDSASPEAVDRAHAAGIRVERHPADKDATDLELALDAALAFSPTRILVLAGGGGRLDHLLASLLLLGSPKWAGVEIDAEIGQVQVHVVRGERDLVGRPGELVSLLALHGPAEAVRTEGLLYELHGETLEPGSSRGVSNVLALECARVSVERGVLLVVRPGPEIEVPAS